MRFLVGFGLLESGDLGFRQQDTILRHLGFERPEAVFGSCMIKAASWRCRRRRKPVLKNRTAPQIEQAVVDLAIEQPAWGQVRVSEALKRQGLSISRRACAACGGATI
jgi:hypothetical protein